MDPNPKGRETEGVAKQQRNPEDPPAVLRSAAEFVGVCPLCRRGGDISPTMPWGRKRVLSPDDGRESGPVECVGRKARQNTPAGDR